MYTVQPGDTLSSIAGDQLGDPSRWPDLVAANAWIHNPDHIEPGWQLEIPELDDRLETPSMRAFTDTPLWNLPNAQASWRHYLGPAHGGEVSPYAAPARAKDLSELPPAYVSTMEFDPLRDEGILYALGMLQAGVSVELHSFPGTFHGSTLLTTAEVSKRSIDETLEVLRRRL